MNSLEAKAKNNLYIPSLPQNIPNCLFIGGETQLKNFFEEDPQVYDQKYKTELCKKFQNTGKCPYGHKCRFAHGKEELITKKQGNNYKKKPCKSFYSKGFCPYGSRCSFKHDERKFLESALSFYYFQLLLYKYSDYDPSEFYPSSKEKEENQNQNENQFLTHRLSAFIELTNDNQTENQNSNLKNVNIEHNSSISTISIDESDNKKTEIKNDENDYKNNLNFNLSSLINSNYQNLLEEQNEH